MPEQAIICPNCGKRIPVSEALTHQIEARLRETFETEAEERQRVAQATFEKRLAAETERLKKQARREAEQAISGELSKTRRDLAEAQKRAQATQARFDRRLTDAKAQIEKQVRKAAEEDSSAEIADLQKQLRDKDKQVADVQRQRAQVQKLQDQLASRQQAMDSEVARKVERALRNVEKKTSEKLEAEYRSRELQLEKQVSDARRQATELKRKLEQSSQQTQGEVIELELEKMLKKAFPDDQIDPIAKGRHGADILHTVYGPNNESCGAIIWESKNMRKWSKGWLAKLRGDQRRTKAELAVLVSFALPQDVKYFGHVDGVWVTDFPLALGVATALRVNLMQVAVLKQSAMGKHGKKMELLYDYLSSTEFRHRIEAMVEAFRGMQDDLNKERRVMENQWAKRDKQIQLVVHNVSGMYGDMQAIAGQALPRIKRLELPARGES